MTHKKQHYILILQHSTPLTPLRTILDYYLWVFHVEDDGKLLPTTTPGAPGNLEFRFDVGIAGTTEPWWFGSGFVWEPKDKVPGETESRFGLIESQRSSGLWSLDINIM
jgi:hypothetical protein